MTYNVLMGMLNLTHSLTHSPTAVVAAAADAAVVVDIKSLGERLDGEANALKR